jgi:predicted methyltransferase
MKNTLLLTIASLFILGCSSDTPEPATVAPADAPAPKVSIYEAAVTSSTRLEGDYARDAARKPAAVLEFFGIEAGDTVFDMFAGGGYYTELLANVVGPEGHVDSHSNKPYLNYVGEEFTLRHDNGRLANVSVIMAENNELELQAEKYDAMLVVLSYHDIYHVDEDSGWYRIDGDQLRAEWFKGLKPGGVVGIIDHVAAAGAPAETGETLHRIDPQRVVAEMTASGFVLDGESNLLHNANDDHSLSVFAPDIRGNTDRFVMRFVKPAE